MSVFVLMMEEKSNHETEEIPRHVLSMTDEESDIDTFRAYLRTVPPEALWDIAAHIDDERYPLRRDTVDREIARRRLFFISPYSVFETRLRSLYGGTVAFAALALALHLLASIDIPLEPGEHLSWFYDLAVGGPAAARIALPLAYLLAVGGSALTLAGSLLSSGRFLQRRMRGDILAMGWLAELLSLSLLHFASTH